MNQLINDLAEHCDFYVGNEHSEETYQEKERLWLEKFAELIIGECIASLDSDDGATHHSELLLEHFGLLKAGENMSDKGYSIGTKEGYDAFVEKRNAGNRSETLE